MTLKYSKVIIACYLQVLMIARSWRFKSSYPHQTCGRQFVMSCRLFFCYVARLRAGIFFVTQTQIVAGYVSFATTFLKRHRLTHAVVPASCKKSRSACLLGCSGLLSLLTFCGIRERSNRPRKMGGDSFYLTLIFEQRYKFEHFFWNV